MPFPGPRAAGWAGFWLPLLIVFAALATAYAAKAIINFESVPLLADTDDAMRLTTVRDLLAGQSWYDPVQHRLNTPFGAELHWSRLIDLPLAALLLLLRPVLGGTADLVVLFVWPLLLLLALLALTARLTVRLVGPEGLLPALVLPGLSLATLVEFAPGRIDHHSVQILLALLLLVLSIAALERARAAAAAGLVAATALAIGIESLPAVLAAILALGLAWVTGALRPAALRSFGLAFALATFAHLLLALPPERWLQPACDAISAVFAAAAAGVGIGFLCLSLLPLRSVRTRLLAGLLAGAAVTALWAVAFPGCLAGPYAGIDPWLMERWIGNIKEALPVWKSIRELTVYTVAVLIPPLLGLAAALIRLARGGDRAAWLIYAIFLAVAVAVMLVQVRGSRLAAELVTPAAAWVIFAALAHFRRRRALLPGLALVGSWVAFTGLAVGILVTLVAFAVPGYAERQAAAGQQRLHCLLDSAFAGLRQLPPQRLMTFIDLGAHVLAYTPHAVVAAPYHRNQQGVRDTFAFFNQPLAEARAILAERRVRLVLLCPHMPEAKGLSDAAPDSFLARRAAGTLPDWLVPLELGQGPLEAYEVLGL